MWKAPVTVAMAESGANSMPYRCGDVDHGNEHQFDCQAPKRQTHRGKLSGELAEADTVEDGASLQLR